MSGVNVQMAASHPTNTYEVAGGVVQTSGSTESIPLPLGGRRKRRTQKKRTQKKRAHKIKTRKMHK